MTVSRKLDGLGNTRSASMVGSHLQNVVVNLLLYRARAARCTKRAGEPVSCEQVQILTTTLLYGGGAHFAPGDSNVGFGPIFSPKASSAPDNYQ